MANPQEKAPTPIRLGAKKRKQKEAKVSEYLKLAMTATETLPFSFTMFMTDENGKSIKFGRFFKEQVEYRS